MVFRRSIVGAAQMDAARESASTAAKRLKVIARRTLVTVLSDEPSCTRSQSRDKTVRPAQHLTLMTMELLDLASPRVYNTRSLRTVMGET